MKKYLVLFLLVFSTTLFADEIINLKADMVVLKCDPSSFCATPVQEGKPIQITLTSQTENSQVIQGEYDFENKLDDINFLGSLTVFKFKDHVGIKYFIRSNIYITKGEEVTNQSPGNVMLNNDINKLNNIIWKGFLKGDDDSYYIISIIVGSNTSTN